METIFREEQEHLSKVHAKLQDIAQKTQKTMDERLKDALQDREDMLSSLTNDFDNGTNLETYAEYEAMNKIIDAYNLSQDIDAERLLKANMLLKKPYFAKVSLQFSGNSQPRDLYIGSVGMTDENCRHFIIDWRSPVAETYYNQSNGKTSYNANGRTIEVDLLLRRQFDITRDTLNACFDTTIAIEDPLLLASLSRNRSAQLQDITATIQKEQNEIIRHKDVPVLLVNGIAGSGKTSVLLQRISYLFYQLRDTLRPDDVYLITPNPVFRQYIDDVLPNMGERNPHILTWATLMEWCGLKDRAQGVDASADTLRLIDERISALRLDKRDFQDICVGDEKVITAGQAFSAYMRYKRFPAGPRRSALVAEELLEKLEGRIKRLSNDDDTQDALLDLSEDEQIRIFGSLVFYQEESELRDFTRQYLEDRYASVVEAIEDGRWLKVDRIGMRLLEQRSLNAAEWIYLKLALAGGNNRSAKYVMVDEVQDYSEAQLMVLSRYFCNAHFLLLGDENQAIKPGTATFEQMRKVFNSSHGGVHECRLLTSYRSSPEITALFTGLMKPDDRVKVSSVQLPGVEPVIAEFSEADEHLEALCAEVCDAREAEGLTAVVVAHRGRVKMFADALQSHGVVVMHEGMTLPEEGVVLLDLPLAKGLEFDRVIIPDVQANVYGEDELSRHRLYTAISRATRKVVLLSCGQISPLLQKGE